MLIPNSDPADDFAFQGVNWFPDRVRWGQVFSPIFLSACMLWVLAGSVIFAVMVGATLSAIEQVSLVSLFKGSWISQYFYSSLLFTFGFLASKFLWLGMGFEKMNPGKLLDLAINSVACGLFYIICVIFGVIEKIQPGIIRGSIAFLVGFCLVLGFSLCGKSLYAMYRHSANRGTLQYGVAYLLVGLTAFLSGEVVLLLPGIALVFGGCLALASSQNRLESILKSWTLRKVR